MIDPVLDIYGLVVNLHFYLYAGVCFKRGFVPVTMMLT